MKLNHSIIIAILLTISPAISLAERDAKAQYNLGVMYDFGNGGPEDDKEALKWWLLAAEQGDAGANINQQSLVDDKVRVSHKVWHDVRTSAGTG
jgi:TPR repeat protein